MRCNEQRERERESQRFVKNKKIDSRARLFAPSSDDARCFRGKKGRENDGKRERERRGRLLEFETNLLVSQPSFSVFSSSSRRTFSSHTREPAQNVSNQFKNNRSPQKAGRSTRVCPLPRAQRQKKRKKAAVSSLFFFFPFGENRVLVFERREKERKARGGRTRRQVVVKGR